VPPKALPVLLLAGWAVLFAVSAIAIGVSPVPHAAATTSPRPRSSRRIVCIMYESTAPSAEGYGRAERYEITTNVYSASL
jgi:hypothetical protein